MKTTLILNDTLVRKAKSRAALEGRTLSRFMEMCLEKELKTSRPERVGDWLHSLPKTPKSAQQDVEARIRAGGFDEIDGDMWR